MNSAVLVFGVYSVGVVFLLLVAVLFFVGYLYIRERAKSHEEHESSDDPGEEPVAQPADPATEEREQRKPSLGEKEFFSLMESLPVGVFKMNLAGEVSYANERFREMFGLSFEENLSEDWLSLVVEDDREIVSTAIADTKLKFRESAVKVRMRSAEGEMRRVSFRFSAAISDNDIHFVGVVIDLDEKEEGGRAPGPGIGDEAKAGGVPEDRPGRKAAGRVLLAEDNLVNQKIMRRMFESLGLSCDVASNGAEAIELWRRGSYELVLLDSHMPLGNGCETARLIRQEERGDSRTPLYALIAPTAPEDRERCLAAGVDDCIAKPVTVEALRTLVAKIGLMVFPEWREKAAEHAEGNPVFDSAVLRRASGGDRRFEEEMLELFLTDTRRRLDRIADLVAEWRDADIVHKEASVIKGMCVTIGAGVMKEAAFRLEKAAAEGDIAGVRSLYDLLEREFARTETVITRYRRTVAIGGGA